MTYAQPAVLKIDIQQKTDCLLLSTEARAVKTRCQVSVGHAWQLRVCKSVHPDVPWLPQEADSGADDDQGAHAGAHNHKVRLGPSSKPSSI